MLSGWPKNIAQARKIQEELKKKIILTDLDQKFEIVAGVDVGYKRKDNFSRAAIVVLETKNFKLIDQATAMVSTPFPYVSGYLSFREVGPIYQAYQKLDHKPDILVCDGQGIAHPRNFGLACHLGLILDKPCLGVAKSRLVGQYNNPGQKKGDWTPLYHNNQVIGSVVRTRDKVKPVFVSPGHKISLETAREFVLRMALKYRLPEPTRLAHQLSQ